jgi:SAM-dependent methyltransferase
VLEVGCGEGIVIQHLTRRHPRLRVDGIELDPAALARARARCPEARLLRGDGYALPVRAGSYDLVRCLEVLEHLQDPGRALDEILRVTRRGCLLSVPHEPFFRLGNLLRGKNLTRLGNPTDHVQLSARPGSWSGCSWGWRCWCGSSVSTTACPRAITRTSRAS